MGGSAGEPGGIYRWTVPAAGVAAGSSGAEAAEMLACSSSQRLPEGYVSVPSLISFPTTLGEAYAYYYAPTNAEYESTDESAPPLLVKVGDPSPLPAAPLVSSRRLSSPLVVSAYRCSPRTPNESC